MSGNRILVFKNSQVVFWSTSLQDHLHFRLFWQWGRRVLRLFCVIKHVVQTLTQNNWHQGFLAAVLPCPLGAMLGMSLMVSNFSPLYLICFLNNERTWYFQFSPSEILSFYIHLSISAKWALSSSRRSFVFNLTSVLLILIMQTLGVGISVSKPTIVERLACH